MINFCECFYYVSNYPDVKQLIRRIKELMAEIEVTILPAEDIDIPTDLWEIYTGIVKPLQSRLEDLQNLLREMKLRPRPRAPERPRMRPRLGLLYDEFPYFSMEHLQRLIQAHNPDPDRTVNDWTPPIQDLVFLKKYFVYHVLVTTPRPPCLPCRRTPIHGVGGV